MSDPRYVTSTQIRAAYDALGLDPELWNSTRSISLDQGHVVATRYLRNESGRRYLGADGEPAREVTFVEVIYKTPAAEVQG